MDTTLLQSFRQHEGFRGAHFYCSEGCRFLPWSEVVQFVSGLPQDIPEEFPDKLLNILANYDPETQFLAVGEVEGRATIELYQKKSC